VAPFDHLLSACPLLSLFGGRSADPSRGAPFAEFMDVLCTASIYRDGPAKDPMSNCHAELLNELLLVELAAARTYHRAMTFVGDHPGAGVFRLIHDQHRAAADTLCREIRQMGCEPEHDCEDVKAFATALGCDCDVCADPAALVALKKGEEKGLHSYEHALRDELLPGTSQTLIRTKLLPQIRKHIEVLEQMLVP
jgi:hypothetical protein